MKTVGRKNLLIYIPTKSKPNSKLTTPDGKTVRTYGPDGKALKDTHYGHPHHHPELKNPHHHDWDWDGDKCTPSPAYNFNIGRGVLGVLLVGVCAIGIIIVAADNVTGVGVADDFLFVPLGRGVSEGLSMIFGG